MTEYQEEVRMVPRRKNRTQLLVLCFSLIVLIFIIYQILASSNILWIYHDSGKDYDTPGVEMETFGGRLFSDLVKRQGATPFQGEKLIHLDLKGAPPLVSYFEKFFPYIKKLGATGLLIEYEDMFYYKDELEDIRAENAYKPSEIKHILDLAELNGLTVIPLIQTFGHLEFVLKLKKYRDLREVDSFPQVLCPSQQRVMPLIQKMIDQILEAHPKSKYIHIGSDEVLYLGKCEKCRERIRKNFWNPSDLYLTHVKNIALYINKAHPGIRPIIWGDMVAKTTSHHIQQYNISNLVDVMVWKYAPDVTTYITYDLLEMYATVFKNIWIASAFKGATGVSQIVTNSRYHLDNHRAWMDIVAKWQNFMNFKGIAITGWQRYDHFAVLCELLPLGIPSLTFSLHFLNGAKQGDNDDLVRKMLRCEKQHFLHPNSMDARSKCDFPGSRIYVLVHKFALLSEKTGTHISIKYSGWFSTNAIVNKFSSPAYVESLFTDWPVDEILSQIKAIEVDLKSALSEVYDKYTVSEWLLTYVIPVRLRLEALRNARDALLGQTDWPRRPLVNHSQDLDVAARKICTPSNQLGCALLLLN